MKLKFVGKFYAAVAIEIAMAIAVCVIVVAVFSLIFFIVNNYIRNQYVIKFKEASSILSQAMSKSQSDNGKLSQWNYTLSQSAEKFAWMYIIPYMDVAKDCGIRKNEGCFAPKTYYKYLNGTKSPIIFDQSIGYKFVHREGMSFYFNYIPNCTEKKQRCFDIYVDVNGPKRGPSQFGRDLYLFYAYPFTDEVKPFGTYSNAKEAYDEYSKRWAKYPYPSDCKKSGWGATCGTKLILEGFEMHY